MKPVDPKLERDLSCLTTVEEIIEYIKAEHNDELNVTVTGNAVHVDYHKWDSADLSVPDTVSYLKGFLLGYEMRRRVDWYDSAAADE